MWPFSSKEEEEYPKVTPIGIGKRTTILLTESEFRAIGQVMSIEGKHTVDLYEYDEELKMKHTLTISVVREKE